MSAAITAYRRWLGRPAPTPAPEPVDFVEVDGHRLARAYRKAREANRDCGLAIPRFFQFIASPSSIRELACEWLEDARLERAEEVAGRKLLGHLNRWREPVECDGWIYRVALDGSLDCRWVGEEVDRG